MLNRSSFILLYFLEIKVNAQSVLEVGLGEVIGIDYFALPAENIDNFSC
jgi:hypothetical protein